MNILVAGLGVAEVMRSLTVDRKAIERQALAKVANWRGLEGDLAARRHFLREVLDKPIYFRADGSAYRFVGVDRRGRLITDLVPGSTLCGVPNDSQLEPPRVLAQAD